MQAVASFRAVSLELELVYPTEGPRIDSSETDAGSASRRATQKPWRFGWKTAGRRLVLPGRQRQTQTIKITVERVS